MILIASQRYTGEINTSSKEKLKANESRQRKAKDILGEGCGGLDEGKCLESVEDEWDE